MKMTDEERLAFLNASDSRQSVPPILTDVDRLAFLNQLTEEPAVQPVTEQARPLTPFNFPNVVSEFVGQRAALPLQAARVTPVGATIIPPSLPEDVKRTVGTAASLPFDPLTYAFGATGAIPSRLARVTLGTGLGATAPLLRNPQPSLAEVGIGAAAGGIGSGLSRVRFDTGRPRLEYALRFTQGPLTTERLLKMTPTEAQKLPASIRAIFIREQRRQLAQQIQQARGQMTQEAQEARAVLKRMDDETLREFRATSKQLKKQLEETAFNIALKLKQTDIGPLLKQQQTRYGDLVEGALARSPDVPPITPQEIITEVNTRFASNPRGLNLAYDRLRLDVLDEFGHLQGQFFSPRELLNEIDRLGLIVPRSPTEAYSFADDVADELRDALLTIIERKGATRGVDLGAIRQAKADWAEWKPIQKRLLRGTRFFEQSETVTDEFVNRLMAFARTDRTKNAENYIGEITSYIGRDFTAPMRPIIEQMTALQRRQVAMQLAQQAESGRIGVQASAIRKGLLGQARSGGQSITDIEIQFEEKALRARRVWQAIIGIGAVTGIGGAVLSGARKISEAIRQ